MSCYWRILNNIETFKYPLQHNYDYDYDSWRKKMVAFERQDRWPRRYYHATEKESEPGFYMFKGKAGELRRKT